MEGQLCSKIKITSGTMLAKCIQPQHKCGAMPIELQPVAPRKARNSGWTPKDQIELMRLEYQRGTPLEEIAAKYGINISTLRSRCQRNGWQSRRVEMRESIQKSASQFVAEAAQKVAEEGRAIVLEVIDDMRLARKNIREKLRDKALKGTEYDKWVAAYKNAIALTRQALGLTEEVQTGPKQVVNVQMVTHTSNSHANQSNGGSDKPMSNPVDLPISVS